MAVIQSHVNRSIYAGKDILIIILLHRYYRLGVCSRIAWFQLFNSALKKSSR